MTKIELLEERIATNLSDFCKNNDEGKRLMISDGIVDVEKYLAAPIKVLWILKEANSGDEGWDMREALNYDIKTDTGLKKGWEKTFKPIVYTTNGIFTGENWDTMGDFNKDPDIIDCMQKVAYINVKKVPGGSVAIDAEIQDFYYENQEALHKQIEIINPDVVLFGNTMKYFDYDLFADSFGELEINEENPDLHIYKNEKHLLLNAYHPNNRKISTKEYCNSIIEAVHQWINR